MSAVEDSVRVCPGCGVPAAENDYCSACGLRLETQSELPTRSEWESKRAQQDSVSLQPAQKDSPESSVGRAPSINPLLHPPESSRLALALLGASLAGLVLVVVIIGVAAASAAALFGVALFIAFLIGTLWLGQQLLRARLLGRSLKVSADTFPELQALLDDVAATLDYHRRVDVYVIDKADPPISTTSYLGTRIILIEGGLAAELIDPERRPQLIFLLGRSLGALKAKHTRVDLIVLLLQAANALRYVSLFLLPWYRVTTYSGDQIGMVCCGNADAALEATRRLLVGKDLASELGAGDVLPQALLVQSRLLPRLIQLFASEPHLTNRYANLICFIRYHDPELWDRLGGSMDAQQSHVLDQLWQRSPHRRRLVGV